MPKVGFEPTRANAHYALNVARLPIPPLRLINLVWQFYRISGFCQPFVPHSGKTAYNPVVPIFSTITSSI